MHVCNYPMPGLAQQYALRATSMSDSPVRMRYLSQCGGYRNPQKLESHFWKPVQNALHPVNAAVKDAADQISDFARQSPDFKFQINGAKATSWLLTTFLDSVSPTSPCSAWLLSHCLGCRTLELGILVVVVQAHTISEAVLHVPHC
jgi:hypothetical protein